MWTNALKGYSDTGRNMKERTSLRRFTFQFIFGIVLGVTGFALTIMLIFKVSIFKDWSIGWALLFMIIGLIGFFLTKYAGWSKIR